MVKVTLVTFASEGPPHDKGLALAGHCLAPYIYKVLQSGVDEAYAFTPRTLIEILGEKRARRCTRELPAPAKVILQGYHNVGFGAWRAELLKYFVDKGTDGDIVILHDPNWIKCPGILTGFAPNARDYATAAIAAAKRTKIFAPPSLTLIHTVTKSVFERLRDPTRIIENLEHVLRQPSGRCRCIVLEINSETRNFVKLFAEACDIDLNLLGSSEETSMPNGGWPFNGFIHNAAEQAVFNSLVYGHGLWDTTQDDWINALSDIGSHDHDTGTQSLIEWTIKNRGWKSDR